MALKDNLKRLREQAGYSNGKELADTLGIAYPRYMTYERGSWPNEEILTKIAKTLHVSMDDLLGYHVSDFDKAAALFHESVGGQAVLNGNIVTFSNTPPAEHLYRPIHKSAFINAINDCVTKFNQETRPKLLKDMIVSRIRGEYYAIDIMNIVKAIDVIRSQSPSQPYDEFEKALEEALEKISDEELTKILMDKSYREKFLSKYNLDTASIIYPPDHADKKPATEKGPHSKE